MVKRFRIPDISGEHWYWTWLLSVDGVGSRIFNRLLSHFKSVEAVWNAGPEDLIQIFRIRQATVEEIVKSKNEFSREEYKSLISKYELTPVFKGSAEYPRLLAETKHSPQILWLLGDKSILQSYPRVAVVGTRHSNDAGEKNVESFVRSFVASDVVIVSGLAFGIDSAAHRAALECGGKTIGVLGSGIAYAIEKRRNEVLESVINGGLVVSPFMPWAAPNRGTFPARNRVLAGMVNAVLVVQAPAKSGALITAGFAREFNRTVFALPGCVSSERDEGSNRLIKENKALMALKPEEIIRCVGRRQGGMQGLNEKQVKIVELIGSGIETLDLISMKMNDDPKLISELGALEIMGVIENDCGRYRLV